MLLLDLAKLLGVRLVGRLAVRDEERALVQARIHAERRLDTRCAALAKTHRALEPVLGDALPGEPAIVRAEERADPKETRHIWREPDRRELPAVTTELVHTERRDDLLNALTQRFDEIRERIGVVERARVLGEQVRVHRVRAERDRDHEVVQVADAPRREHEAARAAQ